MPQGRAMHLTLATVLAALLIDAAAVGYLRAARRARRGR